MRTINQDPDPNGTKMMAFILFIIYFLLIINIVWKHN
jgi:hypothetical protein